MQLILRMNKAFESKDYKMQENQIINWHERARNIMAIAYSLDLPNDISTVCQRLYRDANRTGLEAGCAYRLIRLASVARQYDYNELAFQAYKLASELIQVELSPDPDWETMCKENNCQVVVEETEDSLVNQIIYFQKYGKT